MTCQQNNNDCITDDEKKYFVKFANSFYDEFRKLKYGIKSCRKQSKMWLDEMRKDIIEYQLNNDNN
jgi:hypothetical protein